MGVISSNYSFVVILSMSNSIVVILELTKQILKYEDKFIKYKNVNNKNKIYI